MVDGIEKWVNGGLNCGWIRLKAMRCGLDIWSHLPIHSADWLMNLCGLFAVWFMTIAMASFIQLSLIFHWAFCICSVQLFLDSLLAAAVLVFIAMILLLRCTDPLPLPLEALPRPGNNLSNVPIWSPASKSRAVPPTISLSPHLVDSNQLLDMVSSQPEWVKSFSFYCYPGWIGKMALMGLIVV